MEDMLVLLDDILDANSQPRELPLHFLKSLTDDFSEERVVGRGGFGVVYKGEFKNRTIAVKKLTLNDNADKDFDREIQNLMRVRHKNIVRFLGYVNDTKSKLVNLANPGEPERHSFVYTQQRILCFEYISNGSLSAHIHDELRGPEWHTRYKIIKGICQALDYLHNKKNLVHRDLKPDNILIDNLMAPKVADLGISKLPHSGVSKSMTTNSSATWEYAAPEFADRVVSVKYDIYSLGIIIIELVTGLKQAPSLNTVLTRWRHRWNKSNEALRYQQVRKCIEIGLSCQNKRPQKRPFISKIIKDLEDMDGGNGAARQEIPCWNEQLLWVEPPELFFPFQINKRISCSLQLHNESGAYIAFFIKTYSDKQYEMYPIKGIIQPRSHLSVDIILIAQEEEPEKMWNADEFIINSKKVSPGLTMEDITKDSFGKKSGDIVDKVRIGVVFYAQERAPYCIPGNPEQQLSLEPLHILGRKETGETSCEDETDTQSVAVKMGDELVLERELNREANPTHLSLSLLKRITDDFSEERKIGSGGYAAVYKGVLHGDEIAVKKHFTVVGLEDEAFDNEFRNLKNVQHKNVIRMIGYCYEVAYRDVEYEGKFVWSQVIDRALCFEYMKGGSLATHISDESCKYDWPTTYKIIKGTCEGLHYLHKGRGDHNYMYHMDLTPYNILLDEDFVPKIGGFGSSRLFGGSKTHQTSTTRGTIGYMPPEYINNALVTPKNDVFSLGVIIFYMLAGKQGYNDYIDALRHPNYSDKIREKFVEGVQEYWKKKMEAIVGYRWEETDILGVTKCIEIAMSCVENDRDRRPSTTMIIKKMKKLDAQIKEMLKEDPNPPEIP